MSAPIVYDGVEAGGGGGSLFRGLNFWVAQRVPQRNDIVNKIKANGGDVVPLEKQANMLIADHARKDVPAGSHSWKYVVESVKNGRLEDTDPYRIGRPAAVARPAGSSAPSKGTRNPFTKQDDETLTKWVLLSERKGAMAKGNTIYQDLERMHPNHTWQSWRDRWVKKLSLLPRPNLPDATEDEFQLPELRAPPAAMPRAVSNHAARQQQDVLRPSQGVSRVSFTREDDDLLLEFVREAREHGKYVKGNKIYQELAEQYPHHSYQSWRDRYVRILSRYENEGVETPAPVQARRITNGTSVRARSSAPMEAPASATPAPRRPSTSTASPTSAIAQELKARLRKQQMNRERRLAAQIIQRWWRGYVVRKELATLDSSLAAFQAAARGLITRLAIWGPDEEVETREQPLKPQALPSTAAASNGVGTNLPSSKDQFYKDLQVYISTLDLRINYFPTIGGRNGRAVELWELWDVVTQQDLEPEDRDWEQVAERLGLDWIEYPDVVRQIKAAYEDTLGDFEREMNAFDLEDEDDDDEEEEDEEEEGSAGTIRSQVADVEIPDVDAEGIQETSLPYKSETNIPSSPPLPRGFKRAAAADLLPSSDGGLEPIRKRPRISRDNEIPSTPDARAGPARQDQRPSSILGRTSPPASAVRPRTTRTTRLVEPETQDFGYGRDGDHEIGRLQETQYDGITPSQQLRSESDAVSPVPMSLPRRHQPSTSGRRADSEIFSSTPKASVASKQRLYRPVPQQLASGQSGRRLTEPETAPSTSGAEATSGAHARRSLPTSFGRLRAGEAENNTYHLPPAAFVARSAVEPTSKIRPSTRASTWASTSPAVRAKAAPTSSNSAVPKRESPAEILHKYMAMGYERDHIITAMKATNMRPGWPTSVVLEALAQNKGIPDQVQGVWTERDDKALKFVVEYAGSPAAEAKAKRAKVETARARLENKHGLASMEERRSWFRTYRAAA